MNFAGKLFRGEPLRVLFIDDLGFQYGAGIAMLRQVMAFLHRGDSVAGLCFQQGHVEDQFDLNAPGTKGEWLGMYSVPHLNHEDPSRQLSEEMVIEMIVMTAAAAYPDVIIIGNLHAARWPLGLIPALRKLGVPVITYLHDCYFATGRCAYSGPCNLYRTGCNETCPTADEYPKLAPEKIHPAWKQRRDIFGGPHGVPIAANSRWTLQFARDAIPNLFYSDVVHYGIDIDMFRPGDKLAARRALRIPEDKFVVIAGAVNLQDRRKGGKYLQEIFRAIQPDAYGVVFGKNSNQLDGVQTIDLQRDQTQMPLVYRAADLFVNTPVDEAFGQTMLEASASGIPSVAYRVGGIVDIARDGVNSRLAEVNDVAKIIEHIRFFIDNPAEKEAYGKRGREIAVEEFSMDAQADGWVRYLQGLAGTMGLKA